MLRAEKLKIEYRTLLFQNISFILGNKEKVGLVGLNGCGKTTLLRLIVGEEVPDSGNIYLENEHVEYLPQEFTMPEELLVGEYLEGLVDCPETEMYKVEKILGKLDFHDVDHLQYIETLSPGQKMKLFLAKLLINEPTILLLDEPTNHLDIQGIIWLEKFVQAFKGICIIISHDRDFLNNVTDKIFEIDEQRLYIYEGNYDDYVAQKEEFKFARAKSFHLQEKKREQLEDLLKKARKIGDAKKRGKAVKAAKKRMKREVMHSEVMAYKETKLGRLTIEGGTHDKKRMLELKDVAFGYHETETLFEEVSLEIYGKEKLWFFGPNGIGKSTLIKLIIGELKPSFGEIIWGPNIRWKYFSQEQSHLPEDEKLAEYFMSETSITFDRSFGILEKFLFPKSMRNYKISRLSPGQRARLLFAIFSQQSYDFLILDEPTNHLDIQTKEVIEESLFDFSGAILLVSHDRSFSRGIGPERKITIKNGKLVEVRL